MTNLQQTDPSEKRRKQEAARKRKARSTQSDIGKIDPITDLERREACKEDFGKFCKTYLPEVFNLDWSSSHLLAITRIEEAVLVGGSFAFAMPRGSGKSSLSRAAVLWAILYNHSRFTYLIGANASKGEDALDTIKAWIRYVDLIADDFPEVCQAIQALNGVAQRASSQKSEGVPTELEWVSDCVVLPTVGFPPNHPDYEEGEKCHTAGAIVSVCGLDASGIRGSTHTTTSGAIVRPDLVIVDDPQTDQSAASPTQVEQRYDLISGAVLKMVGPGVKMRGIIPCTIIKRGDLAHKVLDRKECPFWRGSVTKLMPSMPVNMELWDAYFAVYEKCLLSEPLNMQPANDFYIENREDLEEGVEHSWPQRFNPDEVCAIQNGMNLYYQDKSSFMAEMQNEPIDDSATLLMLTVDEIKEKQSSYHRLQVPDTAAYITGHIDVHKEILYYTLVAWSQNFSGTVIDYGEWPDQKRRIYSHRDVKPGLSDVSSLKSEEERIYEGLENLKAFLDSRDYQKPDGTSLFISKCLIDRGYKTDIVDQFCRDNSPIYQGMSGMGVKAGQKQLVESVAKDTLVKGFHWIVRPNPKYNRVQWVLADVNFWKAFMHERLIVGMGGSGCLDLFFHRDGARSHEMYAEHLRSEIYDTVYSDRTGRRVKEWQKLPNRDNHFLDTLVGSCVAGSMMGCELETIDMSAVSEKKKKITRSPFTGFK